MARQTASTVRAAAFRRKCLSLAKTCSMGFRSGEYLGRKNSFAPVERMKALAVDWALDKPWRLDPVMAQGCQKGHSLPAAVWNLGGEPAPEWRPSQKRDN